jgi:diaminopimelate decarboxylase
VSVSRRFVSVTVMNLGGGYKVGRMAGEKSTDLQVSVGMIHKAVYQMPWLLGACNYGSIGSFCSQVVGEPVKAAFTKFAEETGRQLHLEIEPGTFLLANAGALLATIQVGALYTLACDLDPFVPWLPT